jgi:hypothetical protein
MLPVEEQCGHVLDQRALGVDMHHIGMLCLQRCFASVGCENVFASCPQEGIHRCVPTRGGAIEQQPQATRLVSASSMEHQALQATECNIFVIRIDTWFFASKKHGLTLFERFNDRKKFLFSFRTVLLSAVKLARTACDWHIVQNAHST